MLKWSSDEVRERLSYKVISIIDPKFADDNQDDQFSDFNIARNKIIDFARRSELTETEYLLALDMATRGLLTIGDDKVKVYREINQVNLAEIEIGYLEYKRSNKLYEKDRATISLFLNPPQPEPTAEENREILIQNLKNDYQRFINYGEILATPIFYNLVISTGVDVIKRSFIERFLKNFIPEKIDTQISSEKSLPKIIKNDVFNSFQFEVVKSFIRKHKLSGLSQNEWVDYWIKLNDKK